MKLTVFSDCHGNLENAIRILTESEADCYLSVSYTHLDVYKRQE